jgi:hypothetical protein
MCHSHSICFYLVTLYIFIQYRSISQMTLWYMCNVLDPIYVTEAITLIYECSQLSLPPSSNGIFQYPQNKSLLWSSKHNMTQCQPRIWFKIIYLQFNNSAGPQSAPSAKATLFEVARETEQTARVSESKECSFPKYLRITRWYRTNKFAP